MKNGRQHKIGLLLIDMQQPFLDEITRREKKKLFSSQKRLIQECDIPVVVLEYLGKGMTVRKLRKAIRKTVIFKTIIKGDDDGFWKTELEEELRKLGIDTLILAGINADACVMATASSALKAGFRIITCEKLISGELYEPTDKIIDWFMQKGGFHKEMETLLELIK